MSIKFIISGTNTNIGKTIFSAALCHALGASYWKPIQAGLTDETDSLTVARLGLLDKARILPEAFRLKTPASPHLAAKLDNITIDAKLLIPPQISNPLVIEGAGGLLVPITEDLLYADVFAAWKIPVILCASTELGTINHTLLSIEAMRQRALEIFGVAFIGAEQTDTQRIIAKIGKVRILGRLPWLQPLEPAVLQASFKAAFPRDIFMGASF